MRFMLALCLILTFFTGPLLAGQDLRLWYAKPAAKWTEALPLGNGRLGAMVHGTVPEDLLNLNDNTLYSGYPGQRDLPLDITKDLDQVVQMLRDRKFAEADAYVTRHWLGRPQACYQPLGDLHLKFDAADQPTDYRRELDLSTAVAKTTYKIGNVTYTRQYFASHPAKAIIVRITADQPNSVSLTASLTSPHPTAHFSTDSNDTLIMSGQVPGNAVRRELKWIADRGEQWKYSELFDESGKPLPGAKQVTYDGKGTRFQTRLRAITDGGKISSPDSSLKIDGANAVTLLLVSASSYNGFDKNPVTQGNDESKEAAANLNALLGQSFDQLLAAHAKDYQSLFNRVTLDLNPQSEIRNPKSDLPTDQRVDQFNAGGDESLAALHYQFGRYLMISGSRPGGQPLNLQGIWNPEILPPWASAYTVNINTEMNYWPAESTNLSECAQPLFQMLRELSVTGAQVAKNMYHRPGWVLHHNTTIWRDAQPVEGNPRACWWPMAEGWFSEHLWDHYLFTNDQQFLKDTAYPIMKGAAQFLATWLVDDRSGHLVTPVGASPENVFLYDGNKKAELSMGPTMDLAIIRELFTNTIAASKHLDLDADLRADLLSKLDKLAPYKISEKTGRLREWSQEDFDDADPHHRHVSHLYALHPSNQISPRTTPDLAAAAKKTLELRGDKATGWSLAWKINFWARLHDGDHARKLIGDLLTLVGTSETNVKGGGTYPNLFDAHPPFQIDGNFGATAGITEMLLQSHMDEIELLPALPSAWQSGSVTGLRARGGYTLDLSWSDGTLSQVTLTPDPNAAPAKLRYKDTLVDLQPTNGRRMTFDGSLKPSP